MLTRSFVALGLFFVTIVVPSAQSDLDAFMARVLARRDDNWKKLQQYVLEERETLRLDGAIHSKLYGFDREYLWFIRDGVFVRSPTKADGVTIDEDERRREENRWLRRERRREGRRVARGIDPFEPRFVSSAYFLEFKFDPGQYALAGREPLEGREVLRIEYYPTKLFSEGRMRPNRELRERVDDIQEKMNKVALVTLWIEPTAHQIVKYTYHNVNLDFLPVPWLVNIEDAHATMTMGEMFPDVWLPRSIEMNVALTFALGPIDLQYALDYSNYRQADATIRIR
jgi:hypothetical protein